MHILNFKMDFYLHRFKLILYEVITMSYSIVIYGLNFCNGDCLITFVYFFLKLVLQIFNSFKMIISLRDYTV